MKDPLVSVLIPCYNAERYIGETLESVLSQTWRNIEIIVVDDGSSDASSEVVRRFRDERITLIKQDNLGAAAARNRAIQAGCAEGFYCVFLDADDFLEPRFIEMQVRATLLADADVCFGSSVMTWPDGLRVEKNSMPPDSSIDFALSEVLTVGWYPPNAILWKTSFIRAIGGWDETVRRNDDGELIQRALLNGAKLTASAGCHAIYRQHDSADRISSRKDREAIAANILIAAKVGSHLSDRSDFPLSRAALARSLTEVGYEAYQLGYFDLGREAERLARQFGRVYHRGTLLHEVTCAILGAERKAKISRFFYRNLEGQI